MLRLGAICAVAVHTSPAIASDEPIVETDALHPYIETGSIPPRFVPGIECREFYDDLLTTTGNELVDLIRHADISCVSDLERVPNPPLQIAVSREANIIAVGNGTAEVLEDYDGTSRNGVKTLFNFLRIAKEIHYWCRVRRTCAGAAWNAVDAYSIDPGAPAYEAVKGALDAFVEHPLFFSRRTQHGDNLWEVARAIADYDMHEAFLHVVAQWLDAWNEHYAGLAIFQAVMYRILGIVYQGHRRKQAFGPVFGEDRDLIHALRDFVLDDRWLGTTSHWIMDRSAIELGRYSKYRGTTNYDYVLPIIESVLSTYGHDDRAKSIRLRLIAEIDYNDGNRCTRYGLCEWYGGEGFNANFRDALFVEKLACPINACPADTVTIHAQDLGADKLTLACERLADHSQVFQSIFATGCKPVPEDVNSHLEIFVFNDGRSCEDLESAAFGRNPDTCSGIYWEGDPSSAGTDARFVATEYTIDENPRDPDLAIWNFEHEYGHYLDGRYNRHGPYRGSDPAIHWWVEGFAEYFAAEVSPYIGTPAHSSPYTLTDTLLKSGSIPTRYAHRHLAVRYFMQNRRDFVEELLALMRQGKWREYANHMASHAPTYEAEWRAWLRSGGAVQALNRVRGVTIAPGEAQLTVSWELVHGATGYRVRWTSDQGTGETRVRGRTVDSHTISGLIAGTAYTVLVVATRSGFDDGPPSSPVKATPTRPTAVLSALDDPFPIDLRLLFGDGTLRFRAVSDAPELVTASIVGRRLVITVNDPGGGGVATVTVTATDRQGGVRRQTLVVTVEASARSWLRGWRRALLEMRREGGG